MSDAQKFYADPGVIVSPDEFFGVPANAPSGEPRGQVQTSKTTWVPAAVLATAAMAAAVLWVPYTDPAVGVASNEPNVFVAAAADASVQAPRLTEAQERGARFIASHFVKRAPDRHGDGDDPDYGL